MGRVRPCIVDDIPDVVDLNIKLFPKSAGLARDVQQSRVHELYFRSPWYDAGLPSLVYQDDHGKLVGFLGVMPRRMSLQGQTIQAAVSQHLMVDPDSRSTLASVHLLQTFLAGPQDLCMADMGNDVSRKLWERLGGTTALLYSLYWGRPLRPGGFVWSRLQRHKRLALVAWAVMPLCRVVDAIAVRLPQSPFRQVAPPASAEDPPVETLLACVSQCAQDQTLRPEYGSRSFRWLLEMIAQETRYGTLQKMVVQNTKQEVIGWYLYYLNPGGMSKVLQVGAKKQSINEVLDHLFYHAWRHGAVGLSGRLEPRLMNGASRKLGVVLPGTHWMLVHSRHPELLQAIQRGDAFLSHLEGDLELV